LAKAHLEALQGTCTSINASIYRVDATVAVSPVRNSSGTIVGTIGRVEAPHFGAPSEFSVNIIPAHQSLPPAPELSAIAQALFRANAYGVYVLDRHGRINQWSSTMETLTGISADLCHGSPLVEILPGIFELEPHADMRLSKGEHFWLRRVPFRFGDVQDRYFDLSLTPITDRCDCPQGALGILIDATGEVNSREDRPRVPVFSGAEWTGAELTTPLTPNIKQDIPCGVEAAGQVTP
jgi:PAS domain-containing protein